jgi:type I restriction enzyme S subunit
MSRIDELIAEHCPRGLEFKSLEKLGSTYSGLTGKSKADFSNGNARYVSYKNIFNNLAVDLKAGDFVRINAGENQNCLALGDVLFTGSSETPDEVGMSSVVIDEPSDVIYLNSFCFGYRFNNSALLLPGFSKYMFRSDAVRQQIVTSASGVTRFNISKKRFLRVRVPIPPLEVQREIVRVLDTFTHRKLELEAALDKELEARQQQYSHYRNGLLRFVESTDSATKPATISWAALGDLAIIGTGSRNTNEAIPGGIYPFYVRSQEPLAIGEFEYDEMAIITAGDGVGVGKVFHFVDGKYALHQRAYRICVTSDKVVPMFLFHFIRNDFARYLATTSVHASVTSLRRPMFEKYPVPLPPLQEQERIVAILDRLDALVKDLSGLLPAEIKARRQQYKYYHDQLLTFQEAA